MPAVEVTGLGLVSAFGSGVSALEASMTSGQSALNRDHSSSPAAYTAPLPPFELDLRCLDEATAQRAQLIDKKAEPRIRAVLAAALQAWVASGLPSATVTSHTRIALVGAGSNLTSAQAESAAAKYRGRETYASPRLATDLLDTHQLAVVREVLDLHGPTAQVAAASASGNTAIMHGCRLITTGEAEACLVLASSGFPSNLELAALGNTGALSTERLSVPLDRHRSGFTPGEAAAAILLQPSGAHDPGRSQGQILGWAELSHPTTGPDPSAEAEQAVMTAAIASAGAALEDIGYINAHATGSRDGDAAEAAAIRSLFNGHPMPWINSTKSLTGHTLAAAGLVECVATLAQLRLGVLHPMVGLTEPMDEALRLPSPGTSLAERRFALSNGFGFGGFNTSLVLSEASR